MSGISTVWQGDDLVVTCPIGVSVVYVPEDERGSDDPWDTDVRDHVIAYAISDGSDAGDGSGECSIVAVTGRGETHDMWGEYVPRPATVAGLVEAIHEMHAQGAYSTTVRDGLLEVCQ